MKPPERSDPMQEFCAAMRNAGIDTDYTPHGTGKIERFHVHGDKSDSKNGWCILFLEGLPAGSFGNWKSGSSETWSAIPYAKMNRAERDANRRNMEAAKTEREAEAARLRSVAKAKAAKLWGEAGMVRVDHAYLASKRIKPYGIRQLREQLVVPVCVDDTITSLQLIQPDGSKKFLTGGEIKGGYFLIGEYGGTLCIAEGYATACSIHEATGHAVAVAFNAGNLEPVARSLRSKFPEARLILCADDDQRTEGNPGLTKAQTSAQAVSGWLAGPDFTGCDLSTEPTDFNDLHRLRSAEAVKQAIGAAIAVDVPECQPAPDNAAASDYASPDASDARGIGQWEQPVLFGRNVTPEIPPELLPGIFGEYAAALADGLQVSPTMPTLFALSVLSLALQRKFVVSPHGDDYTEPCCIWAAILADSGERKSAIIQRLLAPALLWEAKRKEALASEITEADTLRAINQRRIERLQGDAAKEDSPVRRGELVREIAELHDQTPEVKLPPRLFTGDTTAERLQQMLMEHGGKMAVLTDEGGIFSVMAGIYTGGEAYVDVFLQAYSGSAVRVDRGSRTAIIDRPALTFGIGIQPGLIQDMQPNTKRKFRSSGLFARFFWCYPASNIGKRDMARRGAIPVEMANRYRAAVLGLLDIQPNTNDLGEETEHVLTLSEVARDGWIAFAQKIENGQAEGGKLESLRDWCAKLPGGALRIAGLLHVAEHGFKNGTEISADTMRRAVRLCTLLIPHAVAMFDMVGADPGIEDAKVLWRWIERQGADEFKRNDIHRAYHSRFAKVERLIAALDLLKGRALIAGPYKDAANGGRPSVYYRVNPMALGAA
jgi:putative DNA primase/helicase